MMLGLRGARGTDGPAHSLSPFLALGLQTDKCICFSEVDTFVQTRK